MMWSKKYGVRKKYGVVSVYGPVLFIMVMCARIKYGVAAMYARRMIPRRMVNHFKENQDTDVR